MGFFKDLDIDYLDSLWFEEEKIRANQLHLVSEVDDRSDQSGGMFVAPKKESYLDFEFRSRGSYAP